MELSRVEIIASEAKIGELKDSLSRFGITGMTVFQVLGCGVQNGTQEYELEKKETPNLLPKQMVMLILPTKDLPRFIKFVKEELYSGHIGDGKIFVSDISNVIRVRTGEEGYEAVTSK